jgi:4-hydroxy-3-polyprenylbenzoate decarboxylase
MSGASGAIYGVRILEVLKDLQIETHLVMSDSAKRTIVYETDRSIEEMKALATHVHELNDVGACISSGSFRHDGMVIAPCSIKTLSALAHSFNTNLLVRAADVTLKERRKLVLMVRETPLHLGHLRLMTQVTETGAVLVPPLALFVHGAWKQLAAAALEQRGVAPYIHESAQEAEAHLRELGDSAPA